MTKTKNPDKEHPKTKIHDILECMYKSPNFNASNPDYKLFKSNVDHGANCVVGKDIIELMNREDVQKSYQAVVEAGLNKLPYTKMVIEFDTPSNKYRVVVTLEEVGVSEGYYQDLIKCFVHFFDSKNNSFVMSNKAIYVDTIKHSTLNIVMPADESLPSGFNKEIFIASITFSIYVSFIILNTKGIEKEIIECKKLNGVREQRKKVLIQPHVYLHIGKVYRRDGSEDVYNGPRKMPVHLRHAHTRMQAHGPERSERKLVYIPSVLVNYKPDSGTELDVIENLTSKVNKIVVK